MDIAKGIGAGLVEGSKWAREGRHVIKQGVKYIQDSKGGLWRGKKSYLANRNTTSGRTVTSKMMRPKVSSTEVKRVDLKLDAATAMVAIANVAGNQDFSTGMVATNLIQQGVGDFQRVGNKATVFQTMIQTELSRDAGDAFVRSMVIFDSSPDGTYPAIGDIIKTEDQAGNANTGFFSAMNIHNSDRFRVLRNKVYTLDTYHPKKAMKYVIKNKYDVQYDGTANPLTIGSVMKGTIYWIFFFSGSAPKITNTYIRCKYTDK